MPDHLDIWLIGAGRMARDYATVLQAQGRDEILVIGHGEESARAFTQATGLPVQRGGIAAFLEQAPGPAATAIVATPVSVIAETCIAAIEHGVPRILVEKPAGIDVAEMRAVAAAAVAHKTEVVVAYNRRFYASTLEARRLITADGGVSSFSFEFTEFSDRIAVSDAPERVKSNWFLGNSIHVVDLAYFLGGRPRALSAHVAGSLDWHPLAAKFAGAGVATTGALFSYQANWDAPGRWGVEVLTRERRLILRPLEELKVQLRNSVQIDPLAIDDELDRRFRPGLHRQVSAFLDGDDSDSLLSISDHLSAMTDIYTPMLRPSSA